jgi:hypothetical protein
MLRDESIVKEIQAAQIPETALNETLGLKPETGATPISVRNFYTIKRSPLGFKNLKTTFYFNKHPRLETKWIGKGKQQLDWSFTGFDAGYTGEGSRNLLRVLKTLGFNDWSMKDIQNLQYGTYEII